MTILVTGATGNIGRQVVGRLVAAGQKVRAMTRGPESSGLPAGVDVVQGDFERPETWRAALDGVRHVYLFPFVYAHADHGFVDAAVDAGVTVAALLTDDHVGAAHTVTGPVKVSQAEQVAAIGAAIGAEVRFEELSPADARAQWLGDGFDPETVDWMLELLAVAAEGTGALPPTDAYVRVTGRAPRTFAQWARDHAADFRAADFRAADFRAADFRAADFRAADLRPEVAR